MSPRAAFQLDRLGFGPVYDYAAGKVDWMASGLPTVRANASERRALDAADRAPATCGPDDLVPRIEGGHADRSLVVVDDHSIVLGRVRPDRLATTNPAARVEEVMEPGPATVRAHEPLDPLLERMSRRGVEEIIVTSPQGQLLGVIHHPREPA
jgi:CBS domain-containing protein